MEYSLELVMSASTSAVAEGGGNAVEMAENAVASSALMGNADETSSLLERGEKNSYTNDSNSDGNTTATATTVTAPSDIKKGGRRSRSNSTTAQKQGGQKGVENYNGDKKEEEMTKEEEDGKTLLIAFLLMCFFQLGNRIFAKLATYPMHNYPLYMNLMSTLVYIPLSFAYVYPMWFYRPDIITEEQCNIPKYKFGIMGSLDSIAAVMNMFATTFITNAGIIVLISQSAIPISMVISKVFLEAEYSGSQYVGAAVVLVGIGIVLMPTFSDPTPADDEYASTASSGQSSSGAQLMWICILAASCIPMCLSSVYKEFALGEQDIDVVYLNGWVAVFQAIIAVPLMIPSAELINLPLSEIVPNLYDGMMCNFGVNTVIEATETLQVDHCETGPFYVWVYIAFNLVYNILIIVILKYGSANILWLSSTVIVPLSNLAFSLPFMPNPQPCTPIDLVGLVIIMSGLIIYRFMPAILLAYHSCMGTLSAEELEEEKLRNKTTAKTAKKYVVGLNQVETNNAFFYSKVISNQKKTLFRHPSQIRSSLLVKLGVPPSPLITMASPHMSAGRQHTPNGECELCVHSPFHSQDVFFF